MRNLDGLPDEGVTQADKVWVPLDVAFKVIGTVWNLFCLLAVLLFYGWCLYIVYSALGVESWLARFGLFVASLFVAPFVLLGAPIYYAAKTGDWLPLQLLTVGGGALVGISCFWALIMGVLGEAGLIRND